MMTDIIATNTVTGMINPMYNKMSLAPSVMGRTNLNF